MIVVLDKKDWKRRLKGLRPEFVPENYFTPEYYDSWKNFEKAQPVCLYRKIGETDFFYPFFKKEITNFDIDESFYDIFTAYGYGGIVISNNHFTCEDIQKFNREIDEWCTANNIVSEFVRESHIFGQKEQCVRNVEHIQVRTNVYSDLSKELTEELSNTSKRNIKKAERNKLEFVLDDQLKHYDRFIELYIKTMDKLDSSDYFYFNDEYFNLARKHLKNNLELVCIFDENELISANLCMKSPKTYVYHLGSSDPDKLHKRPNDYLFSKMFLRAKEIGCDYLTLGGGISNDVDDSLFRFKQKFGTVLKPIYVGKKIHNEDVYNDIEKQWMKMYPGLIEKYKNILLKHHYSYKFQYL
jgi:hypothetical protein